MNDKKVNKRKKKIEKNDVMFSELEAEVVEKARQARTQGQAIGIIKWNKIKKIK